MTISPEFPTSSDEIEVLVNPSEFSTDVDGDPITYNVQFYRNGIPVSSPAVVSQFIMQSNLTISGDYWEVGVTANDGYVSSETYEKFHQGYVDAIISYINGKPINLLN